MTEGLLLTEEGREGGGGRRGRGGLASSEQGLQLSNAGTVL